MHQGLARQMAVPNPHRLAPRGSQARVVRDHLLALSGGLLQDLGAELPRQQRVLVVAAPLVLLRPVPLPPAVCLQAARC